MNVRNVDLYLSDDSDSDDILTLTDDSDSSQEDAIENNFWQAVQSGHDLGESQMEFSRNSWCEPHRDTAC
jgi:hypothetical protein